MLVMFLNTFAVWRAEVQNEPKSSHARDFTVTMSSLGSCVAAWGKQSDWGEGTGCMVCTLCLRPFHAH